MSHGRLGHLRVASCSTRRALALISVFGSSAAAQWGPLPSQPGTTIIYSSARGATITDVVQSVRGDTMVVRRATRETSGSVSYQQRRLVKSETGVELIQSGGNQTLVPLPWPAAQRWTFASGGVTYQYTTLGDTSWIVGGGLRRAWKVQLLTQVNGRQERFRLIIVDGVGHARLTALEGPSAENFTLVSLNLAKVPEPRPPRQPISLRPLKWLVPSVYIGGFAAAATHGTDEAPAGAAFRDQFYAGGGAEIGLHHFLGARARIARLVPFDSAGDAQSALGMKSVDVLASTTRFKHRRSIYFGVGYTHFGNDTTEKWLSRPNSAIMGIRSGGDRFAWLLEASYVRDAVDKPLLVAPGFVSGGTRADLLMMSVGMRLF